MGVLPQPSGRRTCGQRAHHPARGLRLSECAVSEEHNNDTLRINNLFIQGSLLDLFDNSPSEIGQIDLENVERIVASLLILLLSFSFFPWFCPSRLAFCVPSSSPVSSPVCFLILFLYFICVIVLFHLFPRPLINGF